MFAMGNVKPERNMNGMKKKNCAIIIACCCDFAIVEMNKPSPSVVRMNNALRPKSSGILPTSGTPNQ